jgi:biopolymer transport protein ExbB
MLSQVFLGLSLVGAEWVLYLLLALSVVSIALIIERWRFYNAATRGLKQFRKDVRQAATTKNWAPVIQAAKARVGTNADLESEMTLALMNAKQASPEILTELAQDSVVRAKLGWERNLSILATIGSNAPFIGLFGTVLGIIKAFHDLSQQAATGAAGVTAGISESLVATAIGILVAIPAVVAFNLFQRKVRSAISEAEALKSFLIGSLKLGE